MDSSRDPSAVAALVGAGTLVGHELGYLAESGAGTGHGYFALIAPLAIVGVVIAVWASALSVLRRGAALAPSVATLAAAQTLLYLAFEVGERTIGAAESSLFSVPVVLGLVAQPLVAWFAVSALRLASAVVDAFIDPALRSFAAAAVPQLHFAPALPTLVVGSSAPARAPPLFF